MKNRLHRLLILCLILIPICLTSCFPQTEDDSLDKNDKNLLDLTIEDFAESDYNSIFVIESLRSVSTRPEYKEKSHTKNSLYFTFTEEGYVSEIKLSVERNSTGLVTKMFFNDQMVTGEAGDHYFSSMTEDGDLNDLPSVIQFDLGYNTLALPCFYGERPISSIVGLINDGIEIQGMYRVSRYLVEMLILERVLDSDSIIDFAITDNIIYAFMRPTDSEAGEYLLWYDGKYLTMAGNLSFTRGL